MTGIAKMPPACLESERFVIATILYEPELLEKVFSFLRPEYFYSGFNAKAFKTLLELHSHTRFDVIILYEKMKESKRLMDRKVSEVLDLYDNDHVNHISFMEHAFLIVDKYQKRLIVNQSEIISARGYNDDISLDEYLSALKGSVENLGTVKTAHRFDVQAEFDEVLKGDYNHTIPWGLEKLDRLTGGISRKEVVTIAGRPRMSKTTFVIDRAIMWLQLGFRVAIFSIEMSKQIIIQNMLCNISGVNKGKVRNKKTTPEEDRLMNVAMDTVKTWQNRLFIFDDLYTYNPIENAMLVLNLDVVIIDWLQNMTLKSQNSKEELDSYLSSMKRLAKEKNISIVIVSMVNRNAETNLDGRPRLKDLALTDKIAQISSEVLFLHWDYPISEMPATKNIVECIIAKSRYSEAGMIYVAFDPIVGRYTDAELKDVDIYKRALGNRSFV